MSSRLQRIYNATNNANGIQHNKFLTRTLPQQSQPVDPKRIKEIILDQRPKDKTIDPARLKLMADTIARNAVPEREKMWAQRTNQPYKTILPTKDIKKEYKSQEELVVYKVNKQDKDEKEFESNVKVLQIAIHQHNKELENVYSPLKRDQCKQEFDYVHKEKYKTKYNPADFDEAKGDAKKYYEQEQYELEKNKKCIDDLLESQLSTTETFTPSFNEVSNLTNSPPPAQSNSQNDISRGNPQDKYLSRQIRV